jgi:hypothetical protein
MWAAASGRTLAGDNSTAHLGERGSATQANISSSSVHIVDHLGDVALLTEKRWITHVRPVLCPATVAPQALIRGKNSHGLTPMAAKLGIPVYIFERQMMAKL